MIIQDEIEGMKPGSELRWAMLTPADVTLGENSATLLQSGKTLHVAFCSSPGAALTVEEQVVNSPPLRKAVPGYRQLVTKVRAGADGKIRIIAAFGNNPLSTPVPTSLIPLGK